MLVDLFFNLSQLLSSLLSLIEYTEWCAIISLQDNKTFVVPAEALETETCEFVTDDNVKTGNELIWRHKGIPYTVLVDDVYGEWHNYNWAFYRIYFTQLTTPSQPSTF